MDSYYLNVLVTFLRESNPVMLEYCGNDCQWWFVPYGNHCVMEDGENISRNTPLNTNYKVIDDLLYFRYNDRSPVFAITVRKIVQGAYAHTLWVLLTNGDLYREYGSFNVKLYAQNVRLFTRREDGSIVYVTYDNKLYRDRNLISHNGTVHLLHRGRIISWLPSGAVRSYTIRKHSLHRIS